MSGTAMTCWIYRGRRRDDTYLYVRARDDFEPVPDGLLEALGALELVMELELGPDRRLARADVNEVMRQLRESGYYLQMPPPEALLGGGRGH